MAQKQMAAQTAWSRTFMLPAVRVGSPMSSCYLVKGLGEGRAQCASNPKMGWEMEVE